MRRVRLGLLKVLEVPEMMSCMLMLEAVEGGPEARWRRAEGMRRYRALEECWRSAGGVLKVWLVEGMRRYRALEAR